MTELLTRYDIRFLFEAGYDDAPKIWAHELYKDKDGDWGAVEDITDRYDFTDEDIEWLIANLKQSDGSAYTDISEFWIDDYFDRDDKSLRALLPPKAIEWLDSLPEYDPLDYSTGEY